MSLAHSDNEREVQIGDSVFQMIGEDDTPFLSEPVQLSVNSPAFLFWT